MPELVLSPEVLEEALAIVSAHVLPRESAALLLQDVARALQVEVNRAELAEMERAQAVGTTRRLCERLKELADTAVIEAWATCPRCRERAPTVDAIQHDERCALSQRPPPRLSLVSPEPQDEPA